MTWNYRIIRKSQRNPIKGGKPKTLHFYDIHEVFYNKKGKATSWTVEPVNANGAESVKDLLKALSMMLRDAIRHPVCEIEKHGKKERLVEL